MYSEWSSLPLEGGGRGVLGAVGPAGGREVVLAVVKQLAAQQEPSPLTTDVEVEWVLEVIRYGLTLPLSEHEALRDCVRVCCAWLAPLLPEAQRPPPSHPPPPAVPAPVSAAARRYARRILKHLHNLFVPRPNETLTFVYQSDLAGDLISKQAVLCHRVLRLARQLAGSAELGASEWRRLLLLLLSAAAALLSPPAAPHSAADQLCERVLGVLFQVWILACHRCFPSPPLWRTLREQCLRWRHRGALVEQWTRVSLCLTARLLAPTHSALSHITNEEDANLIPAEMSSAAVTQAWYRILHTVGSPVQLCQPRLIAQTSQWLQYTMTQEEVLRDPGQHPCLQALPQIFHKAMKGVAAHVDAFLGIGVERWWEWEGTAGGVPSEEAGDGEATPPAHRRLAKSFSVSSGKQRDKHEHTKGVQRVSLMGLGASRAASVATTPPSSLSSHAGDCERPPLAPLRPKVNSIFHLFGEWLFEASLIGTTQLPVQSRGESTPPPPPPPGLPELPLRTQMHSFQPGRAEALGALCRVLCSKQCREAVQPTYLARAYCAIRRGLRDNATAAAVLLNSTDIFRVDLDGVLMLVPEYLSALELVLPVRATQLECAEPQQLRRAAAHILLAVVAVPRHLHAHHRDPPHAGATYGSLAPRIALLCSNALQVEWVCALAAPLLSALYLCVRHASAPAAPPAPGDALEMTPSLNSSAARSESGGSGSGGAGGAAEADELNILELDPNTPLFGSALVVRATYLVCHRLISTWKTDLQVSLAALELLAGLAELHSSRPDALQRKRAVRWICDYIAVQCGRPPPAHSRDLHSCVVAAYACLAAWLCPALAADAECLAALLQVIELGISGAKSHVKAGEPPKMKEEKELKPVSLRVRDAAESLLVLIMEQMGVCEGWSGAWSRLDERWLAARGHGALRHYIVDDNILLSLLEEPLANSQEPQPTVIVIIRGGFGRYAWSMCARGAARCAGRGGGGACARPVDIQDSLKAADPVCLPLPHGPPCAVDSAFPTLESVLRQLGDSEATTLFDLLEQRARLERQVRETEDHVVTEELAPPEPVTEFQTARLFLSNFGYLNIGADKKPGESGRLRALASRRAGFAAALRRVDSAGPRAAATAHLFCCRAGQRGAREILANTASSATVSAGFLNLLRGLGWPVRVHGHAGWTGHVATSYDAQPPPAAPPPPTPADHGGALYSGEHQVLYWADATSEIAFVVPTWRDDQPDTLSQADSFRSETDGGCVSRDSSMQEGQSWRACERSVSETEQSGETRPTLAESRALSLQLDKEEASRVVTGSGRRNRQYATKILIIWLEDFDDHLHLPIDELLQHTDSGEAWRRAETCVVCVTRLRSGLARVRVAPPGRADAGAAAAAAAAAAGPLADGALLTPALLPEALRQTALNVARRRRLYDDQYQPPHTRRRHLIQELAQQYQLELSEPELLESLFRPPA